MTDPGRPKDVSPEMRRLQKEAHAWVSQIGVRTSGTFAPPPRRRYGLYILVATAILLWAGVLAAQWLQQRSDPLPAKLLGTWTANDVRYAGRAMIISDSTMTFRTGEGADQVYPIHRVRRSNAGDNLRYRIDYRDADGPLNVVLEWDPVSGMLRLENLDQVIWHHTRAGRLR
jgi:hypothetical protein